MGRIIFLIFLIAAIPWAIVTLLEMRRCAGPRERAWVGRASVGGWLFSLLAIIVFVMIGMKELFFAIPLAVVAVLGTRYGIRRTRARIRTEEADPLSRAKPLN